MCHLNNMNAAVTTISYSVEKGGEDKKKKRKQMGKGVG